MDLRNPKITFIVVTNIILMLLVGGTFFTLNRNKKMAMNPPIQNLPSQPQNPPKPEFLNIEQGIQSITEKENYDHVEWLANDLREGRMSGKRGNVDSGNYIAKEFESYGLEVSKQKFQIQRMNPGPKNEQGDNFTENIIGKLQGKSSHQIIVGAHMDHIGYGPSMSRSKARNQIHNGADDNASGTAAVLEIAEAFSQLEQPNHTILFICFSAEEMGLIGSRYYVSKLSETDRSNIDLMVNLDMIGWLKGQTNLTISGIREIPTLVSIVEKLDEKYSFTARAGSSGSGGSDHAPFGNVGIPYAFFHTGLHDHYHTPTDDTDKIDFKGLNEVTRFAFEMITEFDKEKLVRLHNVSYPNLNETIHDHGHESVTFPINESYNDSIDERTDGRNDENNATNYQPRISTHD